ncbi:hypothetical protein [Coleofasciculus sp. F4-SAH-05]|jgi:hypothetical protein|uniref:hypothetical protein n=1 Tax=Coleofasciculus TaxID=669368 RepID=UPI003304625F
MGCKIYPSSPDTNLSDSQSTSVQRQNLYLETIRNPLLVKIIAEYSKIGAYPDAIARLSTISYDEPLPDNQGYSVRMQGEVLLTQAYINQQKYEQALSYAQNLELDAAKHLITKPL